MKDELLFCPLGGSGEIGMNMNLFGYGQPGDHKWIMVDIGVTFADDTNLLIQGYNFEALSTLNQELEGINDVRVRLTMKFCNVGKKEKISVY